MSDDNDIFWAFAGAGFGTWWFFRGFRHLRNKRLVENIPTSKCRSIAMGLVEVAGRAAGERTLPSPVGQVPCYAAELVIERYEKRGKNSRWVTVHKEKLGIPFFVEDETGRVRVDPAGAELDIHADIEDHRVDTGSFWSQVFSGGAQIDLGKVFGGKKEPRAWRGIPLEQLDDAFRSFCNARAVTLRGQMRFTEKNLSPGDPVYVLGTAAEVPGVADEHERIVIQKGQHHPWYFIAEASEKEVLSKLGRHTWLHVFGGAGLALAALGWLLFRFGWLM